MSLRKQYLEAMQQPGMVTDIAQDRVIKHFETLTDTLSSDGQDNIWQLASSLLPFRTSSQEPARGIYLWGGVGRGKTWLMNMFYDNLDISEKKRVHFHHFMLDIHSELAESKQRKNPLRSIADRLAKKYRVLCIDEFIVTNITDAMILSELLHGLFSNGVCLVATSNRVPDDLYLNGLQRERFLPAIELIKKHTEVLELDGTTDHRIALLERCDTFYHPITEETENQIFQRIQELSVSDVIEGNILNVLGREINTVYCSEEVAWFDFDTICSSPRAAQDYIELSQRFSTMIVTGIPVMDEYSDDKTRRLIYLIDELYDRNVKLIASADAQPDQLYQGSMLEFAFHRTTSRLIEMRSHEYIKQPHQPFLE
jgi:cell division protein ZapE